MSNPTYNDVRDRAKQAITKKAITKARRNRYIKFSLVLAAVGIGAYLGTKAPMVKIATDVHEIADRAKRMDHNLYEVGTHLNETWKLNEKRIDDDRRAIEECALSGKDVVHYPGIGVFDKELFLGKNKAS